MTHSVGIPKTKKDFCSNSGVRQRSGTKSLQRRPDSGLSEFVGRTFDGFHFLIRFGVWRGERFVDGHVCVPAVAVLPITAVEWDLADGQTLVDAWRKGDGSGRSSPCLIFARFQGSPFLSFPTPLTKLVSLVQGWAKEWSLGCVNPAS